jgi:hypothetical protein
MKPIATICGCGGQQSGSVVLSRLIIDQRLEDVANYNRI